MPHVKCEPDEQGYALYVGGPYYANDFACAVCGKVLKTTFDSDTMGEHQMAVYVHIPGTCGLVPSTAPKARGTDGR